jgi:hypothetical protein
LRLFTDSLDVYRVFHDRDLGVISSSFLALLEALPRATLSPQSVYEYMARFFQGERIYDSDQYQRLCTLELLSEIFGLSVASRRRVFEDGSYMTFRLVGVDGVDGFVDD